MTEVKYTETTEEYNRKHYINKRILCKVNNKIRGFITVSTGNKISYAFGKPTQSEYISFYVDDVETAKSRMEEMLW